MNGTQAIVPQSIQDVFLAQGVIGVVALLAIIAAAYIYKQREKDRERYEVATASLVKESAIEKNAMITRYESALALKDSVIQKIQEDRMEEMRAGMTELSKAMHTVEQVTANFEVAFDALIKRGAA
jgi:TRAP-type C4-dicarboxylate transport system permease large subunit